MKKILILIALFSGILAAQNWTPQKNSVSTINNYGVMKADSITATQVYVVNNQTATKNRYYFKELNTSSNYDSVAFGFSCTSGQVINDNINDTMYVVATGRTFESTVTVKLYPYESLVIPEGATYIILKVGYTASSGKKGRVLAW